VGHVPLSAEQRRLWLAEQLTTGQPYQVVRTHRVHGPLDVPALRRALHEVVDRHDALRVCVVEGKGGPVMRPDAAVAELELLDLSPSDQEDAFRRTLDHAVRPFALDEGPLARLVLGRITPMDAYLVLTVHHIVFDGPSRVTVERDLEQAYLRALGTSDSRGARTGAQPGSFLAEVKASSTDADPDEVEFWAAELEDVEELAVEVLPVDPSSTSSRAREVPCFIDADLVDALRRLADDERTSLFVVLLSAHQYLLASNAAVAKSAVGTAFAGRLDLEVEDTVGYFAKTVPFVAETSGHCSFRSLVQRQRDRLWTLLDHQDVPFEEVATRLMSPRRGAANPFFQHWFSFDDGALTGGQLHLAGADCETLRVPNHMSRFDTEFELWPAGDGLEGALTHAVDRVRGVTAERLVGQLLQLLRRVVDDPDRPLGNVELVDSTERERLLALGDGDRDRRPVALSAPGPTLAERIARVVAEAPDQVAVATDTETCSYAEFWARSNALGQALQVHGAGPGRLVALMLDRGVDLVTAMTAVVISEAAYLTMDPELPAERVRFQLADAGARILVTDRTGDGLDVVRLPPRQAGSARAPEPVAPGRRFEDLLYISYTSGSTGQPKGVAVAQQHLLSLVDWHLERYALSTRDTVAHVASPSFDATGWEVWPALVAGATVRPCPRSVTQDPERLVDWLGESGVTVTFLPTPLAEQVIRYPLGERTRLRVLLTGGDLFRPGPEHDPGLPVIDHYGPTENAVVATASEQLAAPWDDRSIGRPIAGVRAYVLDPLGRLVPHGVAGELHLGGDVVAWGYWGRPAHTAERFMPDPFSERPGARMYRTGDRVAWREDGSLRYLGRGDMQLELRGHRIEAGEVESVLAAHPDVDDVAVVMTSSPAGPVLSAFCVTPRAGNALDAEGLRRFASRRLPGYMLPQIIRPLAALPLTPSGKVDRRQLSSMPVATVDRHPPTSPTEQAMARLWCEVLSVPEPSVDDDFFALGGNSLTATRLQTRINGTFTSAFALRDVFDTRTLREMSRHVEELVLADILEMSPDEIQRQLERGTPPSPGVPSLTPPPHLDH
jgi:amino acid adenylation domain-containing protein